MQDDADLRLRGAEFPQAVRPATHDGCGAGGGNCRPRGVSTNRIKGRGLCIVTIVDEWVSGQTWTDRPFLSAGKPESRQKSPPTALQGPTHGPFGGRTRPSAL